MSNYIEIKITNKSLKNDRLILLNPLGSSYYIWANLIEKYKSSFEIVLLNYPGYGNTEFFDFKTIECLSDEVFKKINVLPKKRTHLIGYSFGGWIAQQLIVRNEYNCNSLILISASNHIYPKGKKMIEGWLKNYSSLGIKFIMEQIALWSFNNSTFESNTNLIEDFYYASKKSFSDNNVLINQLNLSMSYINTLDCSNINIPVLLIRGEYDDFFPYYSTKKLKRMLKTSKIIIVPNTGHSVLIEKPEFVSSEILSFVEKLNYE